MLGLFLKIKKSCQFLLLTSMHIEELEIGTERHIARDSQAKEEHQTDEWELERSQACKERGQFNSSDFPHHCNEWGLAVTVRSERVFANPSFTFTSSVLLVVSYVHNGFDFLGTTKHKHRLHRTRNT